VTFHFTTWRRDGKLLHDSHASAPQERAFQDLFPGVVEVMREMTPGELRRVWVPAQLTVEITNESTTPALDLTIDVELLSVRRAPRAPSLTAPVHAQTTENGLAYEFVKRGQGSRRTPDFADRVRFYHSGWGTNGRLFQTSRFADQPQSAIVLELLPGLAEGIRLMSVGDKAHFWVPATLAYGDNGRRGAPKGRVIFEVELLAID
jgi:FKBP-type peptidyl-prolyl cis-trans isomerase